MFSNIFSRNRSASWAQKSNNSKAKFSKWDSFGEIDRINKETEILDLNSILNEEINDSKINQKKVFLYKNFCKSFFF